MKSERKPGSKARRAVAAMLFLMVATPAVLLTATAAGPQGETPAAGERNAAQEETETTPRRVGGHRVAVGETITIPAGELRDGNVVCIFGTVEVEGIVTGNIVVIGGSLRMPGAGRQNVVGVLSDMELEPGARVGGNLVNVLGGLDDKGAEVRGDNIDLGLPLPGLGKPFSVLESLLLWLQSLSLLLFFVMILILAALVPERMRVLADETPVRYFSAFFVGLAGLAGLVVVILVLSLSVIGAPLIPFLIVVFFILKWLGKAGILLALGRRLGSLLGREMSLLGGALLGFLLYAVLLLVPLIVGGLGGIIAHGVVWWMFLLLLEVPAVGFILLTRAGGMPRVQHETPRAADPPVTPEAAPQAPSEPSAPSASSPSDRSSSE